METKSNRTQISNKEMSKVMQIYEILSVAEMMTQFEFQISKPEEDYQDSILLIQLFVCASVYAWR